MILSISLALKCKNKKGSMSHSTLDMSRYLVQCVSYNWCAINIVLHLCKYCITITFDLDIYVFSALYFFFVHDLFQD